MPRYRQKLSFPRFEMGRPFWIDDPRFNIDYHVRHTALPAPGSLEQLRGLAGRIFSQRLDRSKPLWEIWLAQGLEGGRFALISKTHHALVDGVSGVDIATVLFDLAPRARTSALEAEEAWTPAPEPSQAELVAEGVKGLIRAPGQAGRRGAQGRGRPRRHRRPCARGGRGRRRGGVGGAEPGARRAPERADRPAPAACSGRRPSWPTSRP